MPNSHYENMPFEIPKSWVWTTLGEVANIIGGVSYNKSDISTSGIRIIRGGNIQNGEIILCEDDVYVSTKYKNDENSIQKGDIVVVSSTGSSLLIGKTGYAHTSILNTQIGAFVRIVRPLNNVLPAFVNIIMDSAYYKEYIRDIAKGTNINNIKKNHLYDFAIPLPTHKEQQRIMEYIQEIYVLINSIEESLI